MSFQAYKRSIAFSLSFNWLLPPFMQTLCSFMFVASSKRSGVQQMLIPFTCPLVGWIQTIVISSPCLSALFRQRGDASLATLMRSVLRRRLFPTTLRMPSSCVHLQSGYCIAWFTQKPPQLCFTAWSNRCAHLRSLLSLNIVLFATALPRYGASPSVPVQSVTCRTALICHPQHNSTVTSSL